MNKISKYVLTIIVIIVILFTITGCGKIKNDNIKSDENKEQSSETVNQNNKEKNYTNEMYKTAIRNYYTDNVKDYKVEVINIQSRENGYVTAQVYLTDSNNKRSYEKYEINEKSGKGNSESNLEIDILKYLNEIYENSNYTSSNDSKTNTAYEGYNKEIAEKIMEYTEIAQNSNTSEGDFYMPIEDVFEVTGKGISMTGRIKRGSIKVGDTVDVIGNNMKKTGEVIFIEQFRTTLESAAMNDSVGIIVSGIEKEDVKRGNAIVKCDTMKTSKKIKAKLLTSSIIEKETHQKNRENWEMYIENSYVGCKIETENIKKDMEEIVIIDLEEDMPMEKGMVCYIRSAAETIGVVVIEDVL